MFILGFFIGVVVTILFFAGITLYLLNEFKTPKP